jgi:hypothetical protein
MRTVGDRPGSTINFPHPDRAASLFLGNTTRVLRDRVSRFFGQYPRQFWLMIAGVVLRTAGASMIWPFLLIYATIDSACRWEWSPLSFP